MVNDLAISAQAAPLAPNPLGGPVTYIPNQEWAPLPNDPPSLAPLARHRPSNWSLEAPGGVGTAPTGSTTGAIGTGATAFRTEVPTAAGAQVAPSLLRMARSLW